MSKKPTSLATELTPFIAPFRVDGSRKFHLAAQKIGEKTPGAFRGLQDDVAGKSVGNDDIDGTGILNHKDNFRIPYSDITNVTYNSGKKWGMGPYPHDGKVYVTTADGKKREFIIMGEQSGSDIRNWILAHK